MYPTQGKQYNNDFFLSRFASMSQWDMILLIFDTFCMYQGSKIWMHSNRWKKYNLITSANPILNSCLDCIKQHWKWQGNVHVCKLNIRSMSQAKIGSKERSSFQLKVWHYWVWPRRFLSYLWWYLCLLIRI